MSGSFSSSSNSQISLQNTVFMIEWVENGKTHTHTNVLLVLTTVSNCVCSVFQLCSFLYMGRISGASLPQITRCPKHAVCLSSTNSSATLKYYLSFVCCSISYFNLENILCVVWAVFWKCMMIAKSAPTFLSWVAPQVPLKPRQHEHFCLLYHIDFCWFFIIKMKHCFNNSFDFTWLFEFTLG